MTNFKKQIVSAAAAGAMLLNVAVPAFASTEIVISGNGAGADSWATVNQTSTTTVNQENKANVTNNVDADADTGNNDASFNTGGGVVIGTGNATTDVNVDNNLNRNAASVDCCDAGDTSVNISGNGAYSDNGVTLTTTNTNQVKQKNDAKVDNNINTDAKTGNNDAYSNTGGDVVIVTGNAKANVSVSTTANVNSAMIGGNGGSNPSASFVISGNGAGADNYITAVLSNLTKLDQDNKAHVKNDVDADADTGDNDASFNTGGDVVIDTGHATVEVDVDNAVNFNHADVDCGCVWDVLAKIAGNGADTHYGDKADNIISLTLGSVQDLKQKNDAHLDNDLEYLDADTGNNEVKKNTGEADSDPAVVTGNATSNVGVSNSGNVNTIGDFDFDLPDLPEVDFDFNMAVLWAWLSMSM